MIKTVNIRKLIDHEVFDYQTLVGLLNEYASPRDKITKMIREGVIVRVKKGLYVFGNELRQRKFSAVYLANLIYGPSYVSLEYALQMYSLIPERVEEITSVTTGRSKRFVTPIGTFSFRKVPERAFAGGMDIQVNASGSRYLIAVPEKALVDKVMKSAHQVRTQKEMKLYLSSDLRADISDLMQLSARQISRFCEAYDTSKSNLLAKVMNKLSVGRHQQ